MATFQILGILYSVVMAVIAGLAAYALVLVIIFLRLRIRELKSAQAAELDGQLFAPSANGAQSETE